MLDLRIKNDFPIFKNNPDLVYLDSGATSLKPRCVIDAVVNFYSCYTANIHRGDYDNSFIASKEYDDTRKLVCKLLNNDDPDEIIFTSGTTASINNLAYSYGLNILNKGDVILTTLSEHASDILPWFKVKEKTEAIIKYIPLNNDGTFNIDNFKKVLNEGNVKIVALPLISNVLGYINPIKEISKVAHEKGAIICVDGAQGVPHIKVDVKDLDIDFLSFSAHKMLGPSGVGVLYGKKELLDKMDPLFMGGGANARFNKEGEIILKEIPTRFEAGTPNIEGVIGFKKALEYLLEIGMDNIEKHEKELGRYIVERLSSLPNIEIYNPKTDCSIVSFNVKGIFAQDVGSYLNSFNIAVRTGNHCAKMLHNIIGASETVRVSAYLYNDKEDIDKLYNALKDITLEKCIGAII
ncbi:MAG: aminotransferase class V-fold PLP-dependent enzyme [Erysipelotrichaceae bacterium]|nr:aminotransferase class V-fold PLP-dependent enzyme [Erysipelotrichaceae bacterium]